jgi:hypothetical protein
MTIPATLTTEFIKQSQNPGAAELTWSVGGALSGSWTYSAHKGDGSMQTHNVAAYGLTATSGAMSYSATVYLAWNDVTPVGVATAGLTTIIQSLARIMIVTMGSLGGSGGCWPWTPTNLVYVFGNPPAGTGTWERFPGGCGFARPVSQNDYLAHTPNEYLFPSLGSTV